MTIWLTMLQAKRDAWSLSNTKYSVFVLHFSTLGLISVCALEHFPWQILFSLAKCFIMQLIVRRFSWHSAWFSPKFFLSGDCLFFHSHFPDKEIKVSNLSENLRRWTVQTERGLRYWYTYFFSNQCNHFCVIKKKSLTCDYMVAMGTKQLCKQSHNTCLPLSEGDNSNSQAKLCWFTAGAVLFVTMMCCLPVQKLICTFRDTVGLHGSMPPTAQVRLIGVLSVTIRNHFALYCTAAVK